MLANSCRAAVRCHRPARGGRAGASVQAGGWAYQHCWVFRSLEVVHGRVWETRWAQTLCGLDGREEASHQVAIGLWALWFGGSGGGRIIISGVFQEAQELASVFGRNTECVRAREEARAKARGTVYVQKEVCLAMSECGRRSLGPHVMCPALGWYGYGYGDGCSSVVCWEWLAGTGLAR